MFLDLPPAPPPRLSWVSSVGQRISQLFARPRRVAWFYASPDTSTFRYRAANMVDAVNSSISDVSATWFDENDLPLVEHLIPELDAVVLVRYPYGAHVRRLVDRARQAGVRVLFDCDDLVFDSDYVPVLLAAMGQGPDSEQHWNYWYAYTGRLQSTLSRCDGALTTNEVLRSHLTRQLPGRPVTVVPNFLHFEQQIFSTELLEAKTAGCWRRSTEVVIGYFSGSPSHAQDFAMVAPALARLMRADPGVRLRVVGFLDEHTLGDLAAYAGRIEQLPFTDFVTLQRLIAEVEVNIAPLVHNSFTLCKSDLKYFEAAAVGTWTVASRTPAFSAAIDDGHTGRLARSHEWDQALAEAVRLARDPERYARQARLAADHAHESYQWSAMSQRILDAVLPVA